jgi:hypothetical protein
MIPQQITILGKVIAIPARLYQDIQSEPKDSIGKPGEDEILKLVGAANYTDDGIVLNAATALVVSEHFLKENKFQLLVVYLGIFASLKATEYLEAGKPQDSLGVLVDALSLEHQALPGCTPDILRVLAHRISIQTEEAMEISAALGSADALLSVKNDIGNLLSVVDTVWGPPASLIALILKQIISEFGSFREDKLISRSRSISKKLEDARNAVILATTLSHRRRVLLNGLITSWTQVVQQEIILVANAQYSSEGLDSESISRQAQRLIGQVEQRLRLVITEKYQRQYGDGWIEHIHTRHKNMYESWIANLQRDQAAFRAYREHTPTILEYARFEDLSELVAAQWQLFRDIFEFGYDARNKVVFCDKMFQIAKVRNPLAHNRTIPENELLRARVLCTDILLALDRSGLEIGNNNF